MREKFNFSNIEDQEEFQKLPKEEQDILIDRAQREAAQMEVKIKKGEVKNYGEAERMVEKDKETFKKRYEQVINRAVSPDNIFIFGSRLANRC
jgi:TRAP-type mannitol/chloroaromatic compound transport system substrate-binding protein